ncbi:hypothetical protein CORC01_06899 [Colletotrichum orchidophilum]|uniref:Rhodopsin domain-containing protein n=1 Tax=Colletotrichum orchidophilum TaxID=1209926 RepID=A0A1G4B8X5_9PEZI|nr:uncharacterized protein CORC01_06899 [Colletotrichum orchidophilum]OHE97864.1 hypothetical protein CORC01_06899 [Colletotrichum orchidophilum]
MGIMNILSETSMQTTLWGNKCCLLLLYNRLTLFGHYRKTWVSVATYTGLAYVAVIVSLYGGWCRPFSDYMELQPENLECLTWEHYNILQITMNLSTDLVLLLIPVTLISRLKMKIGKKLLLICLFSMGVFVMLCAILTKVAVFTFSTDPVWFMWCVREVSTAMLVGNLVLGMPALRAAWRCVFPQSRSAPPRDGESSAGTGDTYATYAAKKVTRVGSDAWSSAERGGPSKPNSPPARVAISSVYTDFELYGKAVVKDESKMAIGADNV